MQRHGIDQIEGRRYIADLVVDFGQGARTRGRRGSHGVRASIKRRCKYNALYCMHRAYAFSYSAASCSSSSSRDFNPAIVGTWNKPPKDRCYTLMIFEPDSVFNHFLRGGAHGV